MGGLSECAVILVVMAMGVGETLHRSRRNAESYRIKRRAFHLVPRYGGLLVIFGAVALKSVSAHQHTQSHT